MNNIDQWFTAAAGFSSTKFSLAIRVVILLLALIWAACVLTGFMIGSREGNGDHHPMHVVQRVLGVMMLIGLLWSMMY